MENYGRLRVAVGAVNKVASTPMLLYLILGLISFSNYLLILVEDGDLHSTLLLSISVVVFATSLGLAASGYVKVGVTNNCHRYARVMN